MTSIERRLKEYGASTQIKGNASDKNLTLTHAKKAFFTQREKLPAGWFSFFYVQCGFIRKKWLVSQLLLLILLGQIMELFPNQLLQVNDMISTLSICDIGGTVIFPHKILLILYPLLIILLIPLLYRIYSKTQVA